MYILSDNKLQEINTNGKKENSFTAITSRLTIQTWITSTFRQKIHQNWIKPWHPCQRYNNKPFNGKRTATPSTIGDRDIERRNCAAHHENSHSDGRFGKPRKKTFTGNWDSRTERRGNLSSKCATHGGRRNPRYDSILANTLKDGGNTTWIVRRSGRSRASEGTHRLCSQEQRQEEWTECSC